METNLMLDSEYSVIKSDVMKSFDCILTHTSNVKYVLSIILILAQNL